MASEFMTAEELRARLNYDGESGEFSLSENSKSRRLTVGTVHASGYVKIEIDSRQYLAHRLAWLYVNGEWPPSQLDHINRDKRDNRIANLRLATPAQNNANRVMPLPSSGFRGVYRAGEKFRARITVEGASRHLGCFETAERASECYEREFARAYGEFC